MRLILFCIMLSSSALAVELSVSLPPIGTDINGNRIPADVHVVPFLEIEDVRFLDYLTGSLSFDQDLMMGEQYEGTDELFHLLSIDMNGISFDIDIDKIGDSGYGHTLITEQFTIFEQSLVVSNDGLHNDGLHFIWSLPDELTLNHFEWVINDIGFEDTDVDVSFSFFGTGPVVVVPEPPSHLLTVLALLLIGRVPACLTPCRAAR